MNNDTIFALVDEPTNYLGVITSVAGVIYLYHNDEIIWGRGENIGEVNKNTELYRDVYGTMRSRLESRLFNLRFDMDCIPCKQEMLDELHDMPMNDLIRLVHEYEEEEAA